MLFGSPPRRYGHSRQITRPFLLSGYVPAGHSRQELTSVFPVSLLNILIGNGVHPPPYVSGVISLAQKPPA